MPPSLLLIYVVSASFVPILRPLLVWRGIKLSLQVLRIVRNQNYWLIKIKLLNWVDIFETPCTIDFLELHSGCPNQPRIHFIHFINSLANTIKVHNKVRNSVLEKIWHHREKILIDFTAVSIG